VAISSLNINPFEAFEGAADALRVAMSRKSRFLVGLKGQLYPNPTKRELFRSL
jgi:hypothetical protein